MMSLSDLEILTLIQDPKTRDKGYRLLLSAYQKRVYNIIRKMVIVHEDADDVTQNTFIKAFKNLENFNSNSSIFTWLYRIATNEALTFLSQKSKKQGISNEEIQQKAILNLESDVYFNGDEIQLKLQKAIALLPEKQQLVFKMKYFQELKYEEISEIVDTSVGALKASYHLAVKKIEEYLKSN